MKIAAVHASPNHSARVLPTPRGRSGISLILLHYTDMPAADQSRALMMDPAHRAAAHYLIDTTGDVEQLVDDSFRAWHAGRSFWSGEEDINSISIGIELQNPGHRGGEKPYPWAQISALIELCRALCAKHGIDPEAILGHSDVAPDRKADPGEWFPWEKLAEAGLGFWPEPLMADKAEASNMDEEELVTALGDCGYDTRLPLKTLVTAFQRHFVPEVFLHPEDVGGTDALTRARLFAAARHARGRGGALAFPPPSR